MTTPNNAGRDFGTSGCSSAVYPTKQITVPDVEACRRLIVAWMDSNGVTYRQLASMCGIAAPNLNAMLRGKRGMSQAAIETIFALID
jgi:hypothetical protein